MSVASTWRTRWATSPPSCRPLRASRPSTATARRVWYVPNKCVYVLSFLCVFSMYVMFHGVSCTCLQRICVIIIPLCGSKACISIFVRMLCVIVVRGYVHIAFAHNIDICGFICKTFGFVVLTYFLCSLCTQMKKVPRSKHCADCDRCVERFDHQVSALFLFMCARVGRFFRVFFSRKFCVLFLWLNR